MRFFLLKVYSYVLFMILNLRNKKLKLFTFVRTAFYLVQIDGDAKFVLISLVEES